uniref:Glycoside hydrolase n=1 Tax=Mycena chlorophos TaxID=658473 RepID=A0ABQ0M3Y6_MYCCL|nr:glycoside hydrolase [Mycena chlorophos]
MPRFSVDNSGLGPGGNTGNQLAAACPGEDNPMARRRFRPRAWSLQAASRAPSPDSRDVLVVCSLSSTEFCWVVAGPRGTLPRPLDAKRIFTRPTRLLEKGISESLRATCEGSRSSAPSSSPQPTAPLQAAMVRLGFITTIIAALVALSDARALPLTGAELDAALGARGEGLGSEARDILLSSRAVPTTRWVAYFDKFVSSTTLPSTSDLNGFNVFALAFIYSNSLQDNAATWAEFSASTRSTIKSQYEAAGISLIVSAFGSGPTPTSSGNDPTAAANYIASYVKTYGLDGVDVDYEDFGAVETAGTAVAWLTTFTTVLRQQLPAGQYIITHAPVAPWFSPNIWPDNGYLGVNSAVGNLIDWYNVQFYNQGTSEYTTCSGLLTASSSQWPQSAVFQIAANGVPLNKIVIGKPATTSDASNGYMDPGTLATCLEQAKNQGWSAGAMTWQYPDATSSWITEVRADSFPVGSSSGGGGGGSTTSTTTTSTGGGGGGSCSGAAAWVASAAYTSGSVVSYNGFLWTANQWNEDEVPGGSSGAWNKGAACAGAFQTAPAAKAQTAHPATLTN